MLKRDEMHFANSCLNRAAEDEPVFVLRANDISAPATVRSWVRHYTARKGGEFNMATRERAKVDEAMALADRMEAWRAART